MNKTILGITFCLTIMISLLGMVLLGWKVLVGIWFGSLMGMIGYRMICSMVQSLTIDNGKTKGTKGYMFRYIFYAICLILTVFLELPILAVLVGFLIHKAAIVLYSIERKDFHGRTSK